MKRLLSGLVCLMIMYQAFAERSVQIWHRIEFSFESEQTYKNPLYDVSVFNAVFTAPSGRQHKINGFWDGGADWRIRFMPDEIGEWTFLTTCSDRGNKGLNGQEGSFKCSASASELDIYARGSLTRTEGSYYLTHADGTPFFWLGCTAWNGALKSTGEEWNKYLKHRVDHGYNVIQLVTTQWRGCDVNSKGQVAFSGCGKIEVNPEFFRHLDGKIDLVNEYGLVAAPVLLWALPFGAGQYLSPGYYLPEREAILLARYMVARYGGHHVVWILGGDGKYYGELEDRWLHIGRKVFEDDPPGLVTHHPHGQSWIGNIYAGEEWLDIIGYQSSHSTSERTVNFINRREVAAGWKAIPPKPVMNLEPCYEEINHTITAADVRNACWWSLFATPPSGITYGADGIWPWIREGEYRLNHGPPDPDLSTWEESIDLPGSLQMGNIMSFMEDYPWWTLYPAQELLLEQPGREDYRKHVSVLKTPDHQLVMLYTPVSNEISMLLPGTGYDGRWFDPVEGTYSEAVLEMDGRRLHVSYQKEQDMILVLEKNP